MKQQTPRKHTHTHVSRRLWSINDSKVGRRRRGSRKGKGGWGVEGNGGGDPHLLTWSWCFWITLLCQRCSHCCRCLAGRVKGKTCRCRTYCNRSLFGSSCRSAGSPAWSSDSPGKYSSGTKPSTSKSGSSETIDPCLRAERGGGGVVEKK